MLLYMQLMSDTLGLSCLAWVACCGCTNTALHLEPDPWTSEAVFGFEPVASLKPRDGRNQFHVISTVYPSTREPCR